jgi:hypothetical protein
MDHEARFAGYRRQVEALRGMLADVPGLTLTPKCFTMDERFVDEPVNCLLVGFDATSCGKNAADVAATLEAESPSILAIHEGEAIGFVVDVLEDSEVEYIGTRVRACLKH